MDKDQLRLRLRFLVEIAINEVNPLSGDVSYNHLPSDIYTTMETHIEYLIEDLTGESNNE